MDYPVVAFTAVFLKSAHGYTGFIEELPGVNSHGRTLEEARLTLRELAGIAFHEARRESEEQLAGREVVREAFVVPLAR